jgi:hypothetical protein
MGAFGELFPGAKIKDEAGEAGDGQKWRLGPIDLDKGLVQVHLPTPAPEPDDDEQRTTE